MQGDFLVSNRSLRLPPTIPQAKNPIPHAQCGADDMRVLAGGQRIEELGLHAPMLYALVVERESQDVDHLHAG